MSDDAPKSVNYRKPPAEYQFTKGTSGNPNGRPRKEKAKTGAMAPSGGIFDRVRAMALEEAMLPITVREGEKVERIPAMQAVIRAMFRKAAHNDVKAQRLLLELVTGAESARAEAAVEFATGALKYRDEGLAKIAEHKRMGLPPPEFFPNPLDVLIDSATAEVTVDGPQTKEQAGAEKASLRFVVDNVVRFDEVTKQLESDPRNKELRKEQKALREYRDYFDRLTARSMRREAAKIALGIAESPRVDDAQERAETKRRPAARVARRPKNSDRV